MSEEKKNSLLADVGENGSNSTNLNSFIYQPYLKNPFSLGMSEEKTKIKAERLIFFVGHNFYMSEDYKIVRVALVKKIHSVFLKIVY